MKWYVTDYDNAMQGMAVAGPFETREEADNYVTKNITALRVPALTVGPDDLGSDWQSNLEQWRLK
jgi:hypothetical protein